MLYFTTTVETLVANMTLDDAINMARELHKVYGVYCEESGKVNYTALTDNKELSDYEKNLIESGNWLDAIKTYRGRIKGMTLRGAKVVVDAYRTVLDYPKKNP